MRKRPPWQRRFPGGALEEIRVETRIEIQGVQGDNTQATAIGGINKVVAGVSADCAKKQEDISVDDEGIVGFEVLQQKKSISDVCPEVRLSRGSSMKI